MTPTPIPSSIDFADAEKHAVVIVFISAAVLTPPDFVSQFLMAIPLLALYEIGVILSKVAADSTLRFQVIYMFQG